MEKTKSKSKELARVLVDCGTSYAKIYFVDARRKSILPSRDLLRNPDKYQILASTGHVKFKNSKKQANELVALAEGALSLIDERDFTVLDCGARDVKYVKVKNRRVAGMDWNTECGAFTGQVIELLLRYFDLSPESLPAPAERLPVVCGVLGMTAMFDLISQGTPHEDAFSQFLSGIAFNCETLVGRPDKLYLSGGLCDNPGFVRSFSSETIPLGRFVLIEGLKKIAKLK
jgi:activator of 2-hydroxyglutaryl-CoA dehydratase